MHPSPIIPTATIGGAQRASLIARGAAPITKGYLASANPIPEPTPWEHGIHLYRASLHAATAVFNSDIMLTGLAGAFAHGARLLGTPTTIDAYLRKGEYSRRKFGPNREFSFACHKIPTPITPERVGDLVLAPVPQILIDLARFTSEEKAIVTIDSLLRLHTDASSVWLDEEGIALLLARQRKVLEESEALLMNYGRRHQAQKARRVLKMASVLSESPGESRLHRIIHHSGLALPRQQVEIHTRAGIRRADFIWENERVIAEFDGDIKYTGLDGNKRMLEDRKRDHHLAELGFTVIHFDWKQLSNPDDVRKRLLGTGIPIR